MQIVVKAFHVTAVVYGTWATQAVIGDNNRGCLVYGILPDELDAIQDKVLFF